MYFFLGVLVEFLNLVPLYVDILLYTILRVYKYTRMHIQIYAGT